MRSLNNQAQNYIKENIDRIKKRDGAQTEFIQSVEEVLHSVELSLANHPEYMENSILERTTEPERQYMSKIAWVDDQGKIRTNRGYKVPFNGVLGPFKGGLRFHPSVNLSVIKFLAFEQTFKNALTGLPIGGGKGGSHFDPKGKSEGEIKRFCEAFMTELWRNIGPDTDVPERSAIYLEPIAGSPEPLTTEPSPAKALRMADRLFDRKPPVLALPIFAMRS